MKTITPFEAVNRSSLGERAFEQLRDRIVTGVLKADTFLSEVTLATQFKLSRGPIRDALSGLERIGLAVTDSRGRTCVRRLTKSDYDEILLLRQSLEGLAARLAAERGERADWTAMERNLAAFLKCNDLAALARSDVEFHELIVKAARHDRLLDCWQTVRWPFETLLVSIYLRYAKESRSQAKVSERDHRRILRALRKGDAELSADLLVKHIGHWREWNPVAEATSE